MLNNKLSIIGNIIMILGGILFLVELFYYDSKAFMWTIAGIYIVALAFKFAGWLGAKDEREARKQAKAAKKA